MRGCAMDSESNLRSTSYTNCLHYVSLIRAVRVVFEIAFIAYLGILARVGRTLTSRSTGGSTLFLRSNTTRCSFIETNTLSKRTHFAAGV
jgi:hypothetical protein